LVPVDEIVDSGPPGKQREDYRDDGPDRTGVGREPAEQGQQTPAGKRPTNAPTTTLTTVTF